MRATKVFLLGLTTLGFHVGVQTRAVPNDLVPLLSAGPIQDVEYSLTQKRKAEPNVSNSPRNPIEIIPVLPKPPANPRPVIVPDPIAPKPKVPGNQPKVPDTIDPKPNPKPETGKPIPEDSDIIDIDQQGCPLRRRDGRLIRRCDDVSGVPTVEELKDMLNISPDQCLFYSGTKELGSYAAKAAIWAFNKKNGYRTLPSLWKDQNYPDQFTNEKRRVLNNRASEAMARRSSGVVYVMLPSSTKGTDWEADSVWAQYEWPNLGPGVTKVIRVNPDNDNEEVIKG